MQRHTTATLLIFVIAGCQSPTGTPARTTLGAVQPMAVPSAYVPFPDPSVPFISEWRLYDNLSLIYDVAINLQRTPMPLLTPSASQSPSANPVGDAPTPGPRPTPSLQAALTLPIFHYQDSAGITGTMQAADPALLAYPAPAAPAALSSLLNPEAFQTNEVTFSSPSSGIAETYAKNVQNGDTLPDLTLRLMVHLDQPNQPDFLLYYYTFSGVKLKKLVISPAKTGPGMWNYMTYSFSSMKVDGYPDTAARSQQGPCNSAAACP